MAENLEEPVQHLFPGHRSSVPAQSLPLFLVACRALKSRILLGHRVTIRSRFLARKIKANQANSSDMPDICGAKAACTVPEVIGR